MFRKSILTLLVAVTLGLGAAYFARNWMNSRVAALEQQQREGGTVVVAADVIPFGKKIEPADLLLQPWPHDAIPEGSFRKVEDVAGMISAQRLVRGEPVLETRITDQGGGSSLALLIEPGRRAVTVRVNDVIGVAGFLLPGNRVDVLASRMLDTRKAQAYTVLQDVKVLAVDQTAQPEKDKPVVVRAVTLEVTPRDAESLVQATEEGSVQLALRNPETVESDLMALADQPSQADIAPPSAPAVPVPVPVPNPVATAPAPRSMPPKPKPKVETVTEIRQTQVSQTRSEPAQESKK